MNCDPFGILKTQDIDDLLLEFQNVFESTYKNVKEVDICNYCGNILQRNINNINDTCSNCGIITNEVSDDPNGLSELSNNKLRIVGSNNTHFQPDLYRSDNGNISLLQRKQIFNEYEKYRKIYISNGGVSFPITACTIATDYYNIIQKNYVKRSQYKKSIMAACLWYGCLSIGFAPPKIEIAKFMHLLTKGIAKGDNFIRRYISEEELSGNKLPMEFDPNPNPIFPEIKTLFLQLGYEDEKYITLHNIIYEIIQIANKNLIGISSLPRSKVIGTTYIVLRRCKDKDLVPIPPTNTKEFCKDRVRKNTIDRFIAEMTSYHSYFEAFYKSSGLYSGPL